jgi:hypothetical protein
MQPLAEQAALLVEQQHTPAEDTHQHQQQNRSSAAAAQQTARRMLRSVQYIASTRSLQVPALSDMAAAAGWPQLCDVLLGLLHFAAGNSCSRTTVGAIMALYGLQQCANPSGYRTDLILADLANQQSLQLFIQRHKSCSSSTAGEGGSWLTRLAVEAACSLLNSSRE